MEIEIGFEEFFALQALLDPNLLNSDYKCGLAEAVDKSIQKCPINYRRKLYKKISFSGVSTMFPNFEPKLTVDISGFLGERGQAGVEVQIATNKQQKYAVRYGASKLASVLRFVDVCCSSWLIIKNMAVEYLGIIKRFPCMSGKLGNKVRKFYRCQGLNGLIMRLFKIAKNIYTASYLVQKTV